MTESKQVREKKKKNAQKVAEKAKAVKTEQVEKTEKAEKVVKEVKETKAVKATEKTTKAETANSNKVEKVEKAVKKATGQDENFDWKNGTMLEKGAFVGSLACLVGAIVCLVCEFTMAAESWPFIWFDIFIGLSFLGETLTHWRYNRKLAIITAIGGACFLITGILKLVGVFTA